VRWIVNPKVAGSIPAAPAIYKGKLIMFKWILIGGSFDKCGGKQSGYINKFIKELKLIVPYGRYFNGGNINELKEIINNLHVYDIIFWFPNIPNDEEKIVKNIKFKYPTKLLITSKNNLDEKYTKMELIARALENKANLLLEFTKNNNLIIGTILDPLGNEFCKSKDIDEIVAYLVHRIIKLRTYTRIPSEKRHGEKPEVDISHEFINIVRNYADMFHEIIHAHNTSRLLGNCSFRCEKGFPSFRDGSTIWVSKRNIDKREILSNNFVPVYLDDDISKVIYYGENKPSVDSPIQLMLYNYYPNINYMIHSHTFIDNNSDKHIIKTSEMIPCGAIEEFYEIIKFYDKQTQSIYINLEGHGSIIGGATLNHINNIKFIER